MNTPVLTLHALTSSDHLVHPEEFSDVHLDSPALILFTDFRRHEPIVIDAWMGAVEAERYMRNSHTRLRLVVDREDRFIGTITLEDLSERKLIKRVATGESRYDICVSDLMTPRHELRALAYDDLCQARVKDVLHTLCSNGQRHCLVVEFGSHDIRGLIAASDVARRLHMDLQPNPAPTFAEIFTVVHGGSDPREVGMMR